MKQLENLAGVLSDGHYLKVLIFSALVLGAVLAVTSGFFVPASLDFNPLAEPLKVAIVAVIALLLALSITVLLERHDKAKTSDKKITLVGAITAFFTTTCPFCQPVVLLWLGLGSATAFLVEYSIPISLASIAFLLVSLNLALKSEEVCEVKK